MCSLVDSNVKVRVSSVLNRDTKQFGKKYLFDGEEDTCWNSDQGSPQFVHIEFDKQVKLEEIKIRFQGGFAGRDCYIETYDCDHNGSKIMDFQPEDCNSLQSFKVPENHNSLKSVRVVFSTSTDFFGRITIYQMDIIGKQVT